MRGNRAKLLKRKGEQRTELRVYKDMKNCRNQIKAGTLVHPRMIPAIRHGTLVLRDEVRAVNKQVKRLWTREKKVTRATLRPALK